MTKKALLEWVQREIVVTGQYWDQALASYDAHARGYYQGAFEVLKAVEAKLLPKIRQ